NQPGDTEDEAGADGAGGEQQRVDLTQAAERAGLPPGGADDGGHDGSDDPEQRVADARVAERGADGAVHGEVDGEHDTEQQSQRVEWQPHDRSPKRARLAQGPPAGRRPRTARPKLLDYR